MGVTCHRSERGAFIVDVSIAAGIILVGLIAISNISNQNSWYRAITLNQAKGNSGSAFSALQVPMAVHLTSGGMGPAAPTVQEASLRTAVSALDINAQGRRTHCVAGVEVINGTGSTLPPLHAVQWEPTAPTGLAPCDRGMSAAALSEAETLSLKLSDGNGIYLVAFSRDTAENFSFVSLASIGSGGDDVVAIAPIAPGPGPISPPILPDPPEPPLIVPVGDGTLIPVGTGDTTIVPIVDSGTGRDILAGTTTGSGDFYPSIDTTTPPLVAGDIGDIDSGFPPDLDSGSYDGTSIVPVVNDGSADYTGTILPPDPLLPPPDAFLPPDPYAGSINDTFGTGSGDRLGGTGGDILAGTGGNLPGGDQYGSFTGYDGGSIPGDFGSGTTLGGGNYGSGLDLPGTGGVSTVGGNGTGLLGGSSGGLLGSSL